MKNEAIIHTKKEVASFRDRYGIGSDEPILFERLLADLQVTTLFRPLPDKFSGMAMRAEGHHFMLVNLRDTVGKQNFTICHELYHLFIQKDFTYRNYPCTTALFDTKDTIEYQADLFAAHLLLPEDGILARLPESNKIDVPTLLKIEQHYQCSRSALLYRLYQIGVIRWEERENYNSNVKKEARFNGYDVALYEAPLQRSDITPAYGTLAHTLYNEEKISESHYAELMQQIGINIYFDTINANYETTATT